MPSISVIMPVFNAERYVAQAVESILNQTFTDFEFIIINDGSTDNSLKILGNYAEKDDRIRLFSRENRGLVSTLNEAITLAQAPLIARMDADDVALPNRFKLQYEFMQVHPKVVCLGGGIKVIDAQSRFLITPEIKSGSEAVELSALQGITPICHPTAMYRKDIVQLAGSYQAHDYPAEDLGLFLNLTEYGLLDNLAETVLEYRIHNNSISTAKHTQQIEKLKEICEKHWNKRGKQFEFLAQEGRPGDTRDSQFAIVVKHGWWAFCNQQWKTATIYGAKAIKINPFKLEGWRLLFCGLVKRPE